MTFTAASGPSTTCKNEFLFRTPAGILTGVTFLWYIKSNVLRQKFVSESEDASLAAIASELSSSIYKLRILKRNFEDKKNNVTRFLVFSKKSKKISTDKKVITSIVFNTKNLPASLYKALGGFASNGINLTRLESFFVNRDFKQFSFLIDVESHPEKKNFKNALDELQHYSTKIKILGFYEASPFRT